MRITMALLTAALLSTSCGLNDQAGKRPPDTDDDQPVELGDTTTVPPVRAEERTGIVLRYPRGGEIKMKSATEYYIQMKDGYLPACVEEGKKVKKFKAEKSIELSGEGKRLNIVWDKDQGQIRIDGPVKSATQTTLGYDFMPDPGSVKIGNDVLAEGNPNTYDRFLIIHTCPNGKCSEVKHCKQ